MNPRPGRPCRRVQAGAGACYADGENQRCMACGQPGDYRHGGVFDGLRPAPAPWSPCAPHRLTADDPCRRTGRLQVPSCAAPVARARWPALSPRSCRRPGHHRRRDPGRRMLATLIILWWFATVIVFAVLLRGLAGVRHARSSARREPSTTRAGRVRAACRAAGRVPGAV